MILWWAVPILLWVATSMPPVGGGAILEETNETKKLAIEMVETAFEICCLAIHGSNENDRGNCNIMIAPGFEYPEYPSPLDYADSIFDDAEYFTAPFHAKCAQYFDSDPYATPPADESEVLQDKGKDYAWKAYAHCLLQQVRKSKRNEFMDKLKTRPERRRLGPIPVGRADYQQDSIQRRRDNKKGVAELQRHMPPTKAEREAKEEREAQAKQEVCDVVLPKMWIFARRLCWADEVYHIPGPERQGGCGVYFEHETDEINKALQHESTFRQVIGGLFKDFGPPCKTYFDALKPYEPFPVDESNALIPAIWEKDWPLTGYVHCLVNSYRKLNGDDAIEGFKEIQAGTGGKDWMKILHTKMNRFRAFHNVAPLEIDQSLTKEAQEWADKLTEKCALKSSPEADRQKSTKGPTGESLCNPKCFVKRVPAIDFVNECMILKYSGVNYYPFKNGYNEGEDSTPPGNVTELKEFTQMVWKGTKKVGFGLGGRNCGDLEGSKAKPWWFLVIRYFPAGNVAGQYKENVLPRKDYKGE